MFDDLYDDMGEDYIEGLTQDKMIQIVQLLTGLSRSEAIEEIESILRRLKGRNLE